MRRAYCFLILYLPLCKLHNVCVLTKHNLCGDLSKNYIFKSTVAVSAAVSRSKMIIDLLLVLCLLLHSFCNLMRYVHRGSYMSAHDLLNLLNELRKRDKMRGLRSILSQRV